MDLSALGSDFASKRTVGEVSDSAATMPEGYDAHAVAQIYIVALCNWREARNQSLAAKVAQVWTIKNRVQKPSWWGKDYVSVVTKPEQFSSFNPGDPNSVKWPFPGDPAWADCWTVASTVMQDAIPDPTFGATHYFDKSIFSRPPKWAVDGSMEMTAEIDAFKFWKLKK